MDAPQIQYARTSDGVNIAYWTLGEGGTPLILSSPVLWSHIALEVRDPKLRAFYERLAGGRMIVRFDPRNCGMSQRGIGQLTIEAWAGDIIAVVDRLGLATFDLLGMSYLPAAAFAALHPNLVRRLVLGQTLVRYAELLELQQAIHTLAEQEWTVYTETIAHQLGGWTRPDAHGWAMFIRESVSQEDWLRYLAAIPDWDLGPYLSRIVCPTLIVASSVGPYALPEQRKALAAGIGSSRLVQIDRPFAPHENASLLELIEEFLETGGETARPAAPLPSGTAVILFADIADSTALTERLGDSAFRDGARELDAALRGAIASAGGSAVEGKLLGDGVMAVFYSARQAIEAALACEAAGRRAELPLHLGLHAGDVIREEGNVFGGAVNIAARIADESAPGEVLVSQTVRDLARTSAGVSFEDRGEQELKGVSEPVRVFAVRWRE